VWTIPKLSDSGSRLCGESHIDQGRSGLPAYPAIFVEGEMASLPRRWRVAGTAALVVALVFFGLR
jgi:hypothetical protein